MSAYNTGDYYKHNIPIGQFVHEVDAGDWSGAAPTTLTIQPGTEECIFIKYVVLRVDDTLAMSAGDTIVINIDAYGDSNYEQHTITDTNPLIQLIRLGDSELYEAKVINGVNWHIIKIPYEPPAYLRSSEVPAESMTFTYNDVAGGITAGSILIDVWGWTCQEDDSGVS